MIGVVDDVFVGGGDGPATGSEDDDGDCYGIMFEGIRGTEEFGESCFGAIIGSIEDIESGVYRFTKEDVEINEWTRESHGSKSCSEDPS